jgi:hypothetical protein
MPEMATDTNTAEQIIEMNRTDRYKPGLFMMEIWIMRFKIMPK